MRHVFAALLRSVPRSIRSRLILAGIAVAIYAYPWHATPPAVFAAETLAKAPRFTVKDVTGTKLDLGRLLHRGPVLIDFWATWCAPCVESLPELEHWHRAYGPRGLTVIGVSVDGPRNAAKVRPFTASRGLTYPIVIDRDGTLQERYHVVAIPTAFLIDTTGTITRVRMAYRPGEGDAFERDLKALLPDSTAE